MVTDGVNPLDNAQLSEAVLCGGMGGCVVLGVAGGATMTFFERQIVDRTKLFLFLFMTIARQLLSDAKGTDGDVRNLVEEVDGEGDGETMVGVIGDKIFEDLVTLGEKAGFVVSLIYGG